MSKTKQESAPNGSAPAVEGEPGLTLEFVAKTIDIQALRPTLRESCDMEDALGRTSAQMAGSAYAVVGLAWIALRRVLPNVTLDEVWALDSSLFIPKPKGDEVQDQR